MDVAGAEPRGIDRSIRDSGRRFYFGTLGPCCLSASSCFVWPELKGVYCRLQACFAPVKYHREHKIRRIIKFANPEY